MLYIVSHTTARIRTAVDLTRDDRHESGCGRPPRKYEGVLYIVSEAVVARLPTPSCVCLLADPAASVWPLLTRFSKHMKYVGQYDFVKCREPAPLLLCICNSEPGSVSTVIYITA